MSNARYYIESYGDLPRTTTILSLLNRIALIGPLKSKDIAGTFFRSSHTRSLLGARKGLIPPPTRAR